MPRYIEELVNQQARRSELARQRAIENGRPHVNPVITISRRMGSGARIVAARLAEDLGWSLWDKELLDAMAEHSHFSHRVVEAFDEKAISEIEVFARAALGDHQLGGFICATHLAKAVAAIAKLGNAIILGRGANFLLPNALNVRIDADDQRRIDNMMNYENLTRQEAKARIRASDRERAHFLHTVFSKERVESFHYDITLWMDKFAPPDAAEIIKTALCAWKDRCGDREEAI
ncbi:MAG: hypothetical protein A2Z18_01165 [Armatimonadetes bacterium RBG_16_58_9]|nr:MAG: hypothetical protein A2Z18_01165 [Armatimonadetes bacterium RBG_16_58_9]